MKPELFYLALVTALTGILWVPYILDRMMVWGLMDTVGYPDNPKPQSPWAQRLARAHANAVENLVVFATLVLVAQAANITSAAIGTAAMVYFWGRVVHALAYVAKLPWIRTIGFVVAWAACAVIAWQILVR